MLNSYPVVGGSKSSVNPGTRKYTISGGQKNVFGRLLGVDIILGGGVGGGGSFLVDFGRFSVIFGRF